MWIGIDFLFDNKASWDPLRNMGYVYSAYNRDPTRNIMDVAAGRQP